MPLMGGLEAYLRMHVLRPDLPVLFAGRGGGTIETGRHVRYGTETPMANLFLTMLEKFGTPIARLGDSTGLLTQLS